MVPQTATGRVLFYLLIFLVLGQWLLPLAFCDSLPNRVPVHFDLAGNPDRFAEKSGWELWVGPMAGTFMGILTLIALRFPIVWSIPRKDEIDSLPPLPRSRLYDLVREMILAIFVFVQAMFLTITWMTISFAKATTPAFPWALILTYVLAPLAVVMVYLVRISRALDDAKREAGIPL